jgi:hypothetical protein
LLLKSLAFEFQSATVLSDAPDQVVRTATVKVTLDIAAEIPSGEKLSVTNGGDGRGQLGGHLYLCALFLNQYSRRLAIAS